MTKIVEKGILLTFDEIRILLFVWGVDVIEGVYMPEKDYGAEDVIEALHRLTAKGYIFVEGENFIIRDELREILETMGSPKSTFIQSMTDGREYFCYVSPGRIVVSEHDWKKKDTLKLRVFGPKEFEIWREEMEDDHYRYRSTDAEQTL